MSRTSPSPTGPVAAPAQSDANAAEAAHRAAVEHRRQWFAEFAAAQVMPLLEKTAQALQERRYRASERLREADGRLVAELEIVPRRLPAKALPPRLIITASRPPRLDHAAPTHDRPLLVEFTGTFPHAGATGGFGAEIDYATIFPDQLEEQVRSFVALATGR